MAFEQGDDRSGVDVFAKHIELNLLSHTLAEFHRELLFPLVGGTEQPVRVGNAQAALTDGFVDLKKVRPIARLGYKDYAVVDTIFSMDRPPGGD